MFERYTEKARRVIFFARYEASQFGCDTIETEHLLLGFLREYKDDRRWAPNLDAAAVRERIETQVPRRPPKEKSVDLPLSQESKRALKFAADEADRLAQKHIGTEHLLLGLLDVEDSLAAKILHEGGADIAKMRDKIPSDLGNVFQRGGLYGSRPPRFPAIDTVEIHGIRRNPDYIRDVVSTVRAFNWHWHKDQWRPRDIVIHNKDGTISLDVTLAEDKEKFTLVKHGWRKDHCFICRWELHEGEGDHGVGYTNGRTWICVECCERFVLGTDFFASSQSEMT